ncbi:serine/threonine-protein kinase [Archangium lansingense]|uniref:non-specific serine/threonine protein kinase n=1 Tax=Archangium lansingense TaxID=2995310 RepID=A0ABT4AJB2_9BACT|nr:serine/threonine-protein kinase [Archangium lansinium]MCY1080947.1 protein kinase [Archangium lansinium]
MRIAALQGFTGNERFEVRRTLGVGGFGIVCEAFDRRTGSVVALKTLHQAAPGALYRFKQEFRLLTELAHPNLVTLYELFSEGSTWFFTMELIEGHAFLDYLWLRASAESMTHSSPDEDTATSPLRHPAAPPPGMPAYGTSLPAASAPSSETKQSDGSSNSSPDENTATSLNAATTGSQAPVVPTAPTRTVDAERLRQVFRELVQGLRALHASGLIHRDLKPSNVRVTPQGRVVILDFGLAKPLMYPSAVMGSPEPLAGSPPYMAPEQWALQPSTEATDWYSVGVMLYEALTGQRPFSGQMHEMRQTQRRGVPPISLFVVDAPADLVSLCEELLREDPAARPSGAEVVRRLGGSTPEAPAPTSRELRLVGREKELAALRGAASRSAAGETVLARVHGLAGLGKSALLESFAQELRREGRALVVSGRCYERESVPYKALDSLMDSLSRAISQLPREQVRDVIPEQFQALARLFPVLRLNEDLLPQEHAEPLPEDPLLARALAVRVSKELLRRLAQHQPLVLLLDDLQWGDLDSARFLAELLSPPSAPPLLLVLSYRSDEAADSPCLEALRQLLEPLSWTVPPVEVALPPLSPEESARLALERLGVEDAGTRAQAERIAREAGGSPLLTEEFVRYVTLDGERANSGELSLGRVIDARVHQLPEDARQLLELLAVAGHPLEQTLALDAARPLKAALSSLALLRSTHLLRTRATPGGVDLEVSHDRIRERLVETLQAPAVQGHHRRLAEVLEALPQTDPERLALHLHGAGELVRASLYALSAAERAREALAFTRAAELYGFALEWSQGTPVSGLPPRHELERARAEVLVLAGHGTAAAPIFLRLAESAPAGERLQLQCRAIEHYLEGGRLDDGLALLGPVLERLGLSYPSSTARTLLEVVWLLARLKLRGIGFTERAESEVPPVELQRVDLLWALGRSLFNVEPTRGMLFLLRGLLLALDVGEPHRVARPLIAFGGNWLFQGSKSALESGTRDLERGVELARRLNSPDLLGLTDIFNSVRSLTVGNWAEALERADEGLERMRKSHRDALWEGSMARTVVMITLEATHRMGELRERGAEWYRVAVEQGNVYSQMTALLGTGLGLLATGDAEGARQRLREAVAAWPRTGTIHHITVFIVEAWADLYQGQHAQAWQRITQTWPQVKSAQLLRALVGRMKLHTLRACGAIAHAEHNPSLREKLLASAEKDVDLLSRQGRSDAAAMTHLLRACIARLRGDPAGTRSHLSTAIEGFETAGMAVHAAIARHHQGGLIGGDEGRALVEAAHAVMTANGITEPARWAATFAPGFTGR